GTDTGGSVRIPAALCGLVGFKPTASRVSTRGVLPLSPTLDSVGPIARTVSCCAAVDAVLAGESIGAVEPLAPESLRLGLVETLVWDDADAHVRRSCEGAVDALARAGVTIIPCKLPALREILAVNAAGGFSALESWLWHKDLLRRCADEYDPRVRVRIERGAAMSDADREQLVRAREQLRAAVASELPAVDAWLMPTVPKVAPRIAELETDAAYFEMNRLMLRNPSLVNFLDGCAVSLPCHEVGTAPVGLSVVGAQGQDRRLLAVALAIEPVVGSRAT
ncbi:MAG TPA: amidase family protein, partial [Steroidobacteraceae bacterium]|nr:amidase family protein [Steroidobacteraceae bacterium]